jgi:DNA-binding IclR family transcriptional regulator
MRDDVATQLNNSVAKAFAILRLIGETRPVVTAADLVRELGMNAITAHRFLKTLEHEGALVQGAKGSYRLGYMLADLGERALQDGELGRVLQPVLDAVTADLEEASMATLYQTGKVVCIARAVSGRSLSVDVRVGHRLEAYCTAHGKIWLAHLPERERRRYLDEVELIGKTGATITDRAALAAEIAAARDAGYALNRGEREDGISAIAVPVLSRNGRMIAGLSLFGPSSRLSQAALERALPRLRQAAKEAVVRLYGNPV